MKVILYYFLQTPIVNCIDGRKLLIVVKRHLYKTYASVHVYNLLSSRKPRMS